MCASYNPPNEYITQFNTRLFNQPEDTLSQAEANQLYLSKRTSDTSTAPLTTFQGQVSFNNEAPISNTTPSLPTHLATLAYLTSYYQPITSMSSYLLISVAASTYQTIAGMSDYLTTASAASIYQPISLMVNYLTTASAASTYQPISLMVNYLTTAVASTTYLTIANAASTYLSITNAASTYLTQANAASTYQTIANMTNYVSRTGNVTEDITGTKTFTGTIKSNNYDTQTATTELDIGKSVTTGEIRIGRNKTTGSIIIGSSLGSSQLSVYSQAAFSNFTAITDGQTFQARIIKSSNQSSNGHTLFDDMASGGVLTIGNALSTNTIRGESTFNQAVSVTGLLTATGGLKTNAITPLVGSGQNDIYSSLPVGGTIVFGTASRTLSIYGIVNMVNSCQFSGFLLTNDISFASGQGGTAKTIYTSLTTGGSVTIGSNTANTTTNIRGGAISIGGSANNLTIESPTKFNTKINFYSGTTNYTEFLQTSVQLTLKPVHNNGTIALYSTNLTGVQIEQLLINSSGVSTSTLSSTTIYSGNYNTGDGFLSLGSNTTTQSIAIGAFLTTGNINIGNTTAGTFKTNIRGSLFSTGQATFENFCPKSTTDPSVANDLVKLSYLEDNFCDLSTTQVIGGEKTFTGNTIISSALYFSDLDNLSSLNKPIIYQYGGVLFFTTNNNYSNGYEFMCNHNTTIIINQTDTEINNMVNVKGGLKYRYDKIVDEIQTLTTASEVLEFPLQQTTIFTNTGNISVTLPFINNDTQIGLRFTFLNLGSVSTITTFTAQLTNKIITIGQVIQVSSSTALINNANNSCSLVIVKLSGVYCWAEYI